MTLIALESWDGIATSDLTAKGWTGQVNTPVVSSAESRTGNNSLRLTGGLNESSTGRVTKSLGVGEHATVVIGSALYLTGTGAQALFRFLSDGGATTHITIMCTAAGTIDVRRGTSFGTALGTSTTAMSRLAWNFLECRVTLSDAAGVVEVRLNGATILNLTSIDTKNAGTKTVIDSIMLMSGTTTANDLAYHDDVYILNAAGTVNNTFLGDLRVRCLIPNANGNSSQLTGSDGNSVDNYQLVDEIPPDTADYVGSATLNNKDTYGFSDLPDITGVVHGVQINALATKADAAARSLALVTRSNGADYDGADVALPLGSNLYVQQIRELDPATAAAWTRDAVNGAEFGSKVR